MTHSPPSDPREDRVVTPRPGCLLFALPIIGIALLFVAYGVLVVSGLRGRPPEGPVTTVTFAACPEAEPVIAARVDQIGLHDVAYEPRPEGFAVVATFPSDPGVAGAIPHTLARPGRFSIRSGEDGEAVVGPEGVAGSQVRLDLTMSPSTVVVLKPDAERALRALQKSDPEGSVSLWLDGERIGTQSNLKLVTGGEVEIPPSAESDKARMELAAERAVVVGTGPLPCEVDVVSVTEVHTGP